MSSELQRYSGWRPIRGHRPPHLDKAGNATGGIPNLPIIPAIRFFDNLAYIGDQFVGCFVVYTSEGLILLDSLFPGQRNEQVLEDGLKALGLAGKDVKAVLITHGHGDHYGCAGYLQQKYGTKLYMSEIDEALARDRTLFSPSGYMEFPIDGYLADGQDFTLGDTTIHAVMTPGHTPGCLSFLISVYDEKRPHIAALWGGTGLPRDREMLFEYKKSAEHFMQICNERNVDVEIATHPFVDNSVERFEVIRNIFDGVPNPFVIGRAACMRYEKMFLGLCLNKING